MLQSQLGLLIVELRAVGLTTAPFAQTEVEILVLMLNEQDTSHFCNVYSNVPVDAFQKINLPTNRNAQNPKENLKSEGESPCSVSHCFAGCKVGKAEDSASSGCIPYQWDHKPSKLGWFPPQWFNTPLLT